MKRRNMADQKQQKIKINIPKEHSEGIYSNVAFMNFNQSEFVVDYGRILPGVPEATVYSRIILSPQHAKRFMQLLDRNLKKYEEQFGEIKLPEQGSKKNIGFQQATINS